MKNSVVRVLSRIIMKIEWIMLVVVCLFIDWVLLLILKFFR